MSFGTFWEAFIPPGPGSHTQTYIVLVCPGVKEAPQFMFALDITRALNARADFESMCELPCAANPPFRTLGVPRNILETRHFP